MVRPFYLIKIQQVPSEKWPKRNRLMEIDFVNEYEVESTWEDHTDKATVRLPKNIVLQTDEFLFKQSGVYNVILGGVTNQNSSGTPIEIAPLIMRGDIISIEDGYRYKNENAENQKISALKFSGFVSKVGSDVPIEIECEDAFYLLKRTPVNKSFFQGNMVDLCKYMIEQCNSLFGQNDKYNKATQVGTEDGVAVYDVINPYPTLKFTDDTDSITANFSLGHLDIGNVTCAELLNRMRSQYHLESFFVGNTLHYGFPIYNENRAASNLFFEFESNIHDDHDLKYTNKEDIVLSTIVSIQTIRKTGKKTRDGQDATKKERLSVLIYWDVASETFKYQVKQKGQTFTKNEGGERHECIYPVGPADPEPSLEELVEYGTNQLKKYFYTGFRGSFTTFGHPIVKWNDNVNLISKVFADRNGQYKVRKVVYRGGVDGISQEIHLDYKQQIPLPEITKQISMI